MCVYVCMCTAVCLTLQNVNQKAVQMNIRPGKLDVLFHISYFLDLHAGEWAVIIHNTI